MSDHPPTRLFLDTSVIQAFHDFGERIFDGGDLPLCSRIWDRRDADAQLNALRCIAFVGTRLPFQFCVSDSVLAEIDAGASATRMAWAMELFEHWLTMTEDDDRQLDTEAPSRLNDPRFGFISAKDRLVLGDALRFRCPLVLTLDARLVRACSTSTRALGIEVTQPAEYWARLKPWAALYV